MVDRAVQVVGTAGHVDHGKSTLVKALTGMDPDRFAEEQERGLTIDLGFAWWTLPSGREVGVVDVPGHERFIRNMLAGVGGIDAAMFVVAADEGWKPQSAEHLTILDFLQVRRGVVVLTKADLADDELLELVREDVLERMAGTSLEGARVVVVSAATGAGLDELQDALEDVLESAAGAGVSEDRGRPRMFVDRSFTIAGAGTVVTGTLSGGSIASGDEVEILPQGATARVRSLQTHRRPVDVATPGTRVALNLVGLERAEVSRGDAVVMPGTWRTTDTFAARLRAAADLTHPLGERGAYELYVGSAEVVCRVKFLEDTGDTRMPVLRPGEDALVQVFCMRAMPLGPGDRFIVRDVGRWETVAGGVILDHFPGRVRRGDPQVLEQLRLREASERDQLLARLVAERLSVAEQDLGWLTGLGPREIDAAIAATVGAGRAVHVPGFLVDAEHAESLRERALEAVAAHHAAHRLDAGMPREALRGLLGLEPRLFGELVEGWIGRGDLRADAAVLRLPTHGVSLGTEDAAAGARIVEALREGGVSPPELAELNAAAELVRALERRGDLVVVAPGLAYATDVMARIERDVVDLITREGAATVAQVRDWIGTTRKYAVPLLEYFDGTGLTRRQEDSRVLGPRGRQLASE